VTGPEVVLQRRAERFATYRAAIECVIRSRRCAHLPEHGTKDHVAFGMLMNRDSKS